MQFKKFLGWLENIFERASLGVVGYVHRYDSGYLGLVYSCKTLLASLLSVGVSYLLFGLDVIIWAALMPIYLYFLNVMLLEQKQSIFYFVFFILLSALLCVVFTIFSPYGMWLALPIMVAGFFAGVVGSYDLDLQKVFNMSLLNGLIACIYANFGNNVSLVSELSAIFIGGIIGLLIHFFLSFKKYGKFVRKHFPNLLFDLELMIDNLHKDKNFLAIRNQTLLQIESIKKILNSRAGGIKDAHVMKNTKRTLFYLYRIEEIYQCINSIHKDKIPNKRLFVAIKKELIYNLKQIAGMFEGYSAHLHNQSLEKALSDGGMSPAFVNTLKIIYNKMENIRSGGEEDYFDEIKKKRSIGVIWKSMRWGNGFFRYGVKYACVLGLSIGIAEIFNLDHGAWIAMACVAIIRPSLGGVRSIGRDYFIGAVVGFFIGLFLVAVAQSAWVFYALFVVVVFGFVYFRVYPYGLWASFMMMTFIMMFSAVYGESYGLIVDRILDIALAFGIVFCAFLLLWPRYSGSDVMPNLQKLLAILYGLCDGMMENLEDLKSYRLTFIQTQKIFFACYEVLATALKEARKEKAIVSDIQSAKNSLRYLDFLNQNMLKLYYRLMDMPLAELEKQKELYLNDLNLLKTRYEMLNRALQGNSFYLKSQKDGRFLSQDIVFSEVVDTMFEAQNGLFASLQVNMRKA